MSFWGSENGTPRIELLDDKGQLVKGVNLPRPERGDRIFDWEMEGDPKVAPLTGELLQRTFGFRAVFSLSYRGAGLTVIEDIVDIVNSNLTIKVLPYCYDGSSYNKLINFIAVVTEFKFYHQDGLVTYDSVDITFKGKFRKKTIPNPDVYYTMSKNIILEA